MPLPCPACGFLTVDEDSYGTYNICPICAWEDDALQLANPACGGRVNGKSLILAQRTALAEHPLTESIADNIERDNQWRPLTAVECETAEAEKDTKYWLNKAVYDPANVYWKASQLKPEYILEYLHDAVLHSVECDFNDDRRTFTFSATFHEDSGLAEINGRRVVVHARELTLVQSCIHAVLGEEHILDFSFELSAEAEAILRHGVDAGARSPEIVFSLSTNSGSFWQVACERLEIETDLNIEDST